MSSLFDLSGRTALVTGGGRGVGLAMARAFAAHGARVVIAGRSEKTLAEALPSSTLTTLRWRRSISRTGTGSSGPTWPASCIAAGPAAPP